MERFERTQLEFWSKLASTKDNKMTEVMRNMLRQ